MEKKKRVLFVGSFLKKNKSGGVGGQMYASTTLVNSELKNIIEWVKIDTTAESNLHISLLKRVLKGCTRSLYFFYFLLTKKVDILLIFTSTGFSLLEKGAMAIIGKWCNKKVFFAPRTGWIMNDINSWRRHFINIVFKQSHCIICQGENWKNIFKNYFPSIPDEKFIVIKNWIDITAYPCAKNNNSDKINILFLGFILKSKGIFDLIHAAKRLVVNHSNLVFNIGGSGRDLSLAKSTVANLQIDNFFDFRGWVLEEKKRALLQESDIFVLPSYFEGMPNALLESMASGLPCIAYDVGAVSDIIKDGDNGYTVAPGDVDMLVNKLETLINSATLRSRMGEAARKEIIKNHSMENAVNKFSQIFSSVK